MIPMRQQPVKPLPTPTVGESIAAAERALLHYRDPEPDDRNPRYRDVRRE
jgi:hypothetical protein